MRAAWAVSMFPQATFLQLAGVNPEALAAAHPMKTAELQALTNEELERKCRWVRY